ncbi:MAG TPA: hypothetical protein VEK08_11905 [Planctomycetota bacterium]|nr:hypothetical protein [Planctomycetota bacterium]
MAHNFENITDWEDLENRIRGFENFGTQHGYDERGMIGLLEACIENLLHNENEIGYLSASTVLAIRELGLKIKADLSKNY